MALTDNIIGCWSPSVRGSGYLLPDLSGRGNHGVLTNMDAGTDWPAAAVRGVSGRVLDFDGVNDHVVIPSNGIRFTGPQYVSMWLWFDTITVANRPQVFSLGDFTGQFVTQLAAGFNIIGSGGSEGTSRFAVNAYDGSFSNWGRAYTGESFGSRLNEWIHFCFGHNGTTWQIFVNGVLDTIVDQATGPRAMITTESLYLGGGPSSRFHGGRIGETVFFQRVVTSAEAREIYRQGNGAIGQQLTGQTRRRVYGFVPAAGARRRRILTGMV
jgi:hypothetical protein